MNEIGIKCNLESPQAKNTIIDIITDNNSGSNLTYKFIVGIDGTWKNIKDFSSDNTATWVPSEDGRYIIMVQAKEEGSTKPFDYVSRLEYIIGKTEMKLIQNIYVEKSILNVGEKLIISAEANKTPSMFRFWIKEEENWQLIKDYSADNILKWSVKKPGKQEVMIECKTLDSMKNYDDFEKISFEVKENIQVEITNFRCLTADMLVDSELDFQVEATHDDSRLILYKFVKINSDGETICVQNYSTKRLVTYSESLSGEYKLLCMAKDMYSSNEYDDRAVINYKIKLYNPVSIQSFTSDLSSPQICDTNILFKAVIKGGKNLLYRFMIDGNYGDDSGYSRNNFYCWEAKKAGKYKVMLWVKDSTYEGVYEDSETLDFVIDEVSEEPVKITEVIIDKGDKVLKGETVNVKVIATGGNEVRYNFIVKKAGVEIEKIEYGTCNWVNFTPEEQGSYELEVRVKDKYSKREFDGHDTVFLEAYSFIPAIIDYILLPSKQYHIAGDAITINVIARNTNQVMVKYILLINGTKIEETGYVENKKYTFTPNYPGKYSVEVYAKNIESDNEFDSKKDVLVNVQDAIPVTNTKISCDRIKIMVNEPVNFTVDIEGGKEVIYEFYIWDKNDWKIVQSYSRNKNHSFIPFVSGEYRILVLCKSQFASGFYEDYDILEFSVEA